MAGTDHGELLTKFEAIFGTLVEHEVIKLVLQSCDWESGRASETLLGMIDENDLPPHILNAVLANNIVNGTLPSLADSLPQEDPVSGDALSHTERENARDSPLGLINAELHGNERVNGSPTLQSNALTPLSWAAATLVREEEDGPPVDLGSPSVRPKNRRELEIESDASSPSISPLKARTKSESNGSSCIQDTSKWVLAPEFVPNAFNQDAIRPGGLWPIAVPHSQSPVPVQEQPAVKPKLTKREEIVGKIVKGDKIMVLMRGLPGSGKSSTAKIIKGRSGVILSTDDFFCNKQGVYSYDPSKLSEAHGWNKHRALVQVQDGRSPVIIDNTNLQVWEMKPYIKLALHHGYEVEVLEPETPWRYNPRELARRNIHGVPKQKISDMKDHFDLNVKIESVINSLKNGPNNGEEERQASPSPSRFSGARPKLRPLTYEETKPTVSNASQSVQNGSVDNMLQENDEDADVIVEGYVDEEDLAKQDPDISATQKIGEKSSMCKIAENSTKIPEIDISEMDNDIEGETEINQNQISDEERIKILIEEANDDIDNVETDWDDLALQATGKEVDDSQFNDLVSSFGLTVKEQLARTSRGGSEEASSPSAVDQDDAAMYEFCSNMEDKIGKSLSSLMRPNSGIDYSEMIANASSESHSTATATLDRDNGNMNSMFSMLSMSEVTKATTLASVNSSKDEIDSKNMGNENIQTGHIDNTNEKTSRAFQDKILGKLTSQEESFPVNQENQALLSAPVQISKSEEPLSSSGKSNRISTAWQGPGDSLTSWECVDANAGVCSISWDAKQERNDSDTQSSKPNRSRRNRAPGDPYKWLKDENTGNTNPEVADNLLWEPVQGAAASWDSSKASTNQDTGLLERNLRCTSDEVPVEERTKPLEPQPHTGAVPKFRRHQKHSRSPSGASNSSGQSDEAAGRDSESPVAFNDSKRSFQKVYIESETQTLSIDFEALQFDNNLYELKVIYGQPNYKPKSVEIPETGALTKGRLRLDKGTMTEDFSDVTIVRPLQNLVAFFPNISEDDLRDVLQKCKYDLDWAMNVLLDSGYEMTDSIEVNTTQEEEIEMEVDTESPVETASTGTSGRDERSSTTGTSGRDDRSSFADCSDMSSDLLVEDRPKKMRQSQDPSALTSKKEIEASFTLSESVDDRVKRLTGKEYGDLNTTKVKQTKNRKRHTSKKSKVKEENVTEAVNGDDTRAQYVTLVMDPLFASQLTNMFGTAGSCGTGEDRSVILPLELCLQIHKYWGDTIDGKFSHETEVLDSLIREDENLARRLQEEEHSGKSSSEDQTCGSKLDPPTNFREIMELEQALQESQDGKNSTVDPSLSSHLNLQRLYTEYPHVDPEALREEFTNSGFNYQETVHRICSRYGAEQGTPKTVIAPEALYRYEQQMIQKAQKESLELHERTNRECDDEGDYEPDDPQVFRDEARMHYNQRQEYFRKAQDANSQGMKAVAAYYARLGNLHATKLIEANQRASKKILEAINADKNDANTLDLHHLHVNEAVSAAQAFLKERENVLRNTQGNNQMKVYLITGRGSHSIGGQARLKPAVRDSLKSSGYLVHEVNSGMFAVTLKA